VQALKKDDEMRIKQKKKSLKTYYINPWTLIKKEEEKPKEEKEKT